MEFLMLIGGALMRLIPMFVDGWKQKQDASAEVERLKIQVQLEEARSRGQAEVAQVAAAGVVDGKWAEGLAEALKAEGSRVPSGYALLDWISSSVRPILTYWWCMVMYTGQKVIYIAIAVQQHMPLEKFAPILLTDFDRGVVSSILGFWFMDRTLRNNK